ARARELYLEAGRPLEAAVMLVGMATDAARNGAPNEEVRSYVEEALQEVEVLPATPERERTRANLLAMRAADWLFASQTSASRADAVAARDLAASVGDREVVLETDLLLARIDIVEGRCDSGLAEGLRAARAARDAGFESVGVTGYRNLAILAARIMDGRTAELAMREGLQYADAIEQSHCRQMMATTKALLDWGAGRWEEADALARQELVERGCRRGVIGALDVIGLVALGRGSTDEARRWLSQSLTDAGRIGEAQLLLTPLWGLAEVDLILGDAAAAAARCEEAWSLASGAGERALFVPFVVTGARSLVAARRPDDAERWVLRAREYLAGWESVAGPALSHAEGLVRLASGSLTAARDALEQAARGWEEHGRVWPSLWARLDLAQALVRSGRHADAADAVARVRARAAELGSRPLLSRADELARSSRAHAVTGEPWRPLTVREYEVARLIAEGRTNIEIAAALSVSPRTVSSHVEHVLSKLGAARRTEIASWVATVPAPALARESSTVTAIG
ncbi:MAG TPA: LuxR C-terminal-related transcriptional regulator, partial [Candidatus Limnocylindrales bacterium]